MKKENLEKEETFHDDWAKSILNERYGLLDVIDKTKTGIEESKMKFCTDCGEKLNPH